MNSITLFFKSMTLGKYLLLLISPLLVIILSMKPLLFALIIIISIDLLTGIRKAHYLSQIKFKPWKKEFWKVIKSSELRKSWKKTTEYFIGIIVFIVLQMLVFKGLSVEAFGVDYSLAELAVVVACMVEVYSIYENMEAVSGNNLFKRVLNLLPTKIKDIFKSK
jgi:hypothetical protein